MHVITKLFKTKFYMKLPNYTKSNSACSHQTIKPNYLSDYQTFLNQTIHTTNKLFKENYTGNYRTILKPIITFNYVPNSLNQTLHVTAKLPTKPKTTNQS